MNEKKTVIKSVRISASLNEKVSKSAKILEVAEQDMIRLALKIGLACLERTGYDIPEKIAAEALEK